MGSSYVQTTGHRKRDRWQGNNSELNETRGKERSKTQKKEAEQNQKNRRGGYMVHWDAVEVHPRGPTATVYDKLKGGTQN